MRAEPSSSPAKLLIRLLLLVANAVAIVEQPARAQSASTSEKSQVERLADNPTDDQADDPASRTDGMDAEQADLPEPDLADQNLAGGDWMKATVASASGSVVLITVEGRDGRRAGLGTGFVVSADGLIATNLHVIGEARPITVRFHDGRELPVTEVYATDRHLDLAVVRVSATGLKPLPLQPDGQRTTPGQAIIALGNPMGLRHSVVAGVISAYREIDGRDMIQVAMPIEPGNSGGPLLDSAGSVLGVVTLKSAVTANLGFAIQVDALRQLLAKPNPIAMSRWETIGALNANDWEVVLGGRWRQRSGRMVASEPGRGFGGRSLCLARQSPPDDGPYEVGVWVKLEDESGAAGLVFGSDGGERHFGFYPSGGRLRLTRFDGDNVYQWQVLDERAVVGYRAGEWNHLKVRIDQDALQAFVNDERIMTWPMDEPPRGRVGMAKFRDTDAEFRGFQVAGELPKSQVDPQRLAAVQPLIDALAAADPISDAGRETLLGDPEASRAAMRRQAEQLRAQADRLSRWADDVHVQAACRALAEELGTAHNVGVGNLAKTVGLGEVRSADPIAAFDSPDPQTPDPQTPDEQPAPEQAAPEQAEREQAEREVNLVRAALLISSLDNPELNVQGYVDQVNRMGDEIRRSLQDDASPQEKLAALNRYLFQENGFHGSRTQYYQPANSYFDRMLDDREGLPITLSVLYLELGRQVGIKLEGIGLPGHFMVRFVGADGTSQLIDVFEGGTLMSQESAIAKSEAITGTHFRAGDLDPSSAQEIVTRMLRNLQALAQQRQDAEPLLRYLEALVAVAPDQPAYRGMRAVVRHQTGRVNAAVEDLDWFLEQRPNGVDLDAIRVMKERFTREPPR